MARGPSKKRRGNYQVGKGRPPIATRWKPGQSGNPKGRPKGAKNMLSYFNEALSKKIPIKEGGRTRYVPVREIIAKTMIARAAKGDFKSIAYLLNIEPEIARRAAVVKTPPAGVTPEEAARVYFEMVKTTTISK